MFEKFKDYMFYLLHYPIKEKKFYILFTVLGNIFDQIKETIFEVRKQSNILTATGRYLEHHGRDRDLARLKGEDDESYRRRLIMKVEIAKKAGTLEGMKLALESIGYENSRIEPCYLEDGDRWAEFVVYLSGKHQSCIDDLRIIDGEIMKVKQASAKPAYAVEEYTHIKIESTFKADFIQYPLCNLFLCGTHPMYNDNVGYQFESDTCLERTQKEYDTYPLVGVVVASEETHKEINCNIGELDDVDLNAYKIDKYRSFEYPLCNQIITGEEVET